MPALNVHTPGVSVRCTLLPAKDAPVVPIFTVTGTLSATPACKWMVNLPVSVVPS